MSGATSPGSPPPEVPEELADVYRAAYAEALAEHASETRQAPTTPPEKGDDTPTGYERVRDSGWFVPVLLVLLALLLVFGAYTIGKRFASQVANDSSPSGAVTTVLLSSPESGSPDRR